MSSSRSPSGIDAPSPSSSSSSTVDDRVVLHIYDLLPEANDKYLHTVGLGIYHTGVEVFGQEYWFFGHEHDFSGIVVLPLGLTRVANMRKREHVVLGRVKNSLTTDSRARFHRLVDELTHEFAGSSYHLIHRNCNHFSETFARNLLDRKSSSNPLSSMVNCCGVGGTIGFPHHVNRAAYLGSWLLWAVKEEHIWRLVLRVAGGDPNQAEVMAARSQHREPAARRQRIQELRLRLHPHLAPGAGGLENDDDNGDTIAVDIKESTRVTHRRPEHSSATQGPALSSVFTPWETAVLMPPEKQRSLVTAMFSSIHDGSMVFGDDDETTRPLARDV